MPGPLNLGPGGGSYNKPISHLHQCWRGLVVCGCGVGLWVKTALALLMATCTAKEGKVVSPPLETWMGDGQSVVEVLPWDLL